MTVPIIAPELVALDVSAGSDKTETIGYLARRIADAGRAQSVDGLIEAALAREAQSATGLPGGIAIPHCRTAAVTDASLAFARLDPRVDFGAADAPADLVFLIAAPESGGSQHMKLLSALARSLVRPEFVASLRAARTPDEVVALVEEAIAPKPAAAPKSSAADAATAASAAPAPAAVPVTSSASDAGAGETSPKPTLIAITACPTGIAHTYMAADALKLAADRAGVDLVVETQGSSGSTPLSAGTIAAAGAVIFATDVGVKGRERFAGKPVIASGVKRGINEPDAMIAEAVAASSNPNAPRVSGAVADAEDGSAAQGGGNVGWGTRIRQILLTGVSYMIPFVAAGGLLLALGFLLAGYEIGLKPDGSSKAYWEIYSLENSLANLPPGGLRIYLGAVLFALGQAAFFFLVPALAGYIAFAIADRPGLTPGFTAGLVAVWVGAGFIGGLVAGVLAGVVSLWIARIPLPKWARGLMPVIIIPLFATLITGGLLYLFLGRPLTALTNWLTDGLNGMSGSSKILLGVVLGLMMCFDLGGPVNKAAYAFAALNISATSSPAQLQIMAAVMCAGMVPPLAMGVATLVRKRLFTPAERENGLAAIPLGLCFISEGAIPFAAADPLRVIPSMMLGGATAGGVSMALGVGLRAPHGGIFVVFAMQNVIGFFIALLVGTAVSTVAVVAAKTLWRRPVPTESAQPVLATA